VAIGRHDESKGLELTTYATRLASYVDETGTSVSAAIPRQVAFGATLPLDPARLEESVAARWKTETAESALVATLGVTTTGTFELDLAGAGPHALVGGTTGSGKSEFLRTLVLSLACRYSPRELSLILIDYKGLAALGDFKHLPHQVGLVSNLEAADVKRVIDFLRQEIQRRQMMLRSDQGEYVRYRRRLAKHESTDEAKILPRLVVVIDEFAGFAEAERKNIDAIIDIAARGRSLGVHLVLATQRPGTGIPKEVTANIDARFCLRTLDEQDSVATIDTSAASEIAKSLVGRAFARLASGSLLQFQVAWAEADSFERRSMASDLTLRNYDPLASRLSTEELVTARDESRTDFQHASRAILKAAVDQRIDIQSRELDDDTGILMSPAADQPIFADALPADLGEQFTQQPDDINPIPYRVAIGRRDEPQHQRQSVEYVNLKVGSFLYVGGSLSGRTEVLTSLVRRFVTRTHARLVVVDGGDGALAASMSGYATTTLVNPSREQLDFLYEQLELKVAPGTEEVLVVIDRLDVVAGLPRDVERVASLMINGPSSGVYFAATADSRAVMEPGMLRAFQWRYTAHGDLPGRASVNTDNAVQLLRRPPAEEAPAKAVGKRRPLGLPGEDLGDWASGLPTNQIYLGIDEISHTHVGVSVRSGLTIAGGQTSGKTTTLLSVGERIAQRLGYPIPLLAPYDFASPSFANVQERVPAPRRERLWLTSLAPEWWQKARANFLLIDDVTEMKSYFSYENDEQPLFGPAEQTILAEFGVRLIVAGDISVLGQFGQGLDRIQRFSDRNFFVLQPPSALQVERHNINIHWDAVVKPRTWRSYLPGEGVLVTPSSRFDVRVVPSSHASDLARFAETERGEL